jgi:hypothetical protein
VFNVLSSALGAQGCVEVLNRDEGKERELLLDVLAACSTSMSSRLVATANLIVARTASMTVSMTVLYLLP